MQPHEFREDLRRARDLLQDIIGEKVCSFRAPSFSVVRRSLWALEILVEEGFETDSSIFPTRHHRYGMRDAIPELHGIRTPAGVLIEFPLSVYRFAGWNVPIAGGGYFRLFPLWWTIGCLRHLNRALRPFVFYLHPWEIDPRQPRLPAGTAVSRLRHRINLAATEGKFRQLLGSFRFAPVRDVVNHVTTQAGDLFPQAVVRETEGELSLHPVV